MGTAVWLVYGLWVLVTDKSGEGKQTASSFAGTLVFTYF